MKRVTGAKGFEGRCNACRLDFNGEYGYANLLAHRKESHARCSWRYKESEYADGKPWAWSPSKPKRGESLEQILARYASEGLVEVESI